MLHFNTFYEGHRRAVLALAGSIKSNFFYSAGSEGLVVRWQLNTPNEGEVIIRLQGYISCLKYDEFKQQLIAAVNHKGLYILNPFSGGILGFVDIPTTAFQDLKITAQNIILTTEKGEIIFIERGSSKIVFRKQTGLNGHSVISIDFNYLWFTSTLGLQLIDLKSLMVADKIFEMPLLITAIAVIAGKMVVLGKECMQVWELKKWKKLSEVNDINLANSSSIWINLKRSSILLQFANNNLYEYLVEKKELKFEGSTQNEHIGRINDLLWIENHKFVISAGTDKKIGIWQLTELHQTNENYSFRNKKKDV